MTNRNSLGVMSVFVAGLSLIVLFIGFFVAELWQANIASWHLKNCCDAASMAAAARLVSATETQGAAARLAAAQMAENVLKAGSVLGASLSDAQEVEDIDNVKSLPVKRTAYSIRFVDDSGAESANGKHIRVKAAFAAPPFSGRLLGLGAYLVKTEGRSSAAKLDLAFCLDNSLSMATDTPVALVNRRWDGTKLQVVYDVVSQGKANQCGASIGVLEPLFLNSGNKSGKAKYHFEPSVRHGYRIDETNYPEGNASDVGTLPGNVTSGGGELSIPHNSFSDRVILAGGKFSQIPVAVEALRGNLESSSVFVSSGAMTAFSKLGITGIQPHEGFKAEYEAAASPLIQPFSQAKDEVKDFFQLMERNTNSHFCLIPFSSGAAAKEGQKKNEFRVDKVYEQGGRGLYSFGKVELNKTKSKFDKVTSEIDTYQLFGGTAIPAAVAEATKTLTNDGLTRSDARRAILIFTDGEPTGPAGTDPVADSIAQARKAGEQGITLYAVGFIHGGVNQEKAKATLEAMAQSTPGGRAFIVQDIEGLHQVFRLLARELVTLE